MSIKCRAGHCPDEGINNHFRKRVTWSYLMRWLMTMGSGCCRRPASFIGISENFIRAQLKICQQGESINTVNNPRGVHRGRCFGWNSFAFLLYCLLLVKLEIASPSENVFECWQLKEKRKSFLKMEKPGKPPDLATLLVWNLLMVGKIHPRVISTMTSAKYPLRSMFSDGPTLVQTGL